ncbi:MAG: hypothetical protein DHS80DRAFT_24651 [Piptocephalis tieghemiana]|nr:MAG: hypothetical protein DHS80DRAFT_24651 [Piptocephalis tieghemiana]
MPESNDAREKRPQVVQEPLAALTEEERALVLNAKKEFRQNMLIGSIMGWATMTILPASKLIPKPRSLPSMGASIFLGGFLGALSAAYALNEEINKMENPDAFRQTLAKVANGLPPPPQRTSEGKGGGTWDHIRREGAPVTTHAGQRPNFSMDKPSSVMGPGGKDGEEDREEEDPFASSSPPSPSSTPVSWKEWDMNQERGGYGMAARARQQGSGSRVVDESLNIPPRTREEWEEGRSRRRVNQYGDPIE